MAARSPQVRIRSDGTAPNTEVTINGVSVGHVITKLTWSCDASGGRLGKAEITIETWDVGLDVLGDLTEVIVNRP